MANLDDSNATLTIAGQSIDLPVVVGTEHEQAVDISRLRGQTGHITLDNGFANTGACQSGITFIDGEKGILRYRGIPVEQLAQHSSFVETALLLIYGELPTAEQLHRFRGLLCQHERLHEGLRKAFESFPSTAHPMAILSAMINTISCYHPDVLAMEDEHTFESAAARLISKVRTVAAAAYKASRGEPIAYPNSQLGYCENFLHMMFSLPYEEYEIDADAVDAIQLFLILHADHEQNCSTSTVRMVASSGANLFASCASGVCALWGPLHGGANTAVLQMLTEIHKNNIPFKDYMERVKKKQVKLMGFGHRVYKAFDPRAKILKAAADKILNKLGVQDPLLDLARGLEEVGLEDDYFRERNLYPNVDFYSGVILRALGIPLNMFTVMFAMGRMPGWIAHWKEQVESGGRISRPRQVYIGEIERSYVRLDQR